jgi:hypothetical protein
LFNFDYKTGEFQKGEDMQSTKSHNQPIDKTQFGHDPDFVKRIMHPRDQSIFHRAPEENQNGLRELKPKKESLTKALRGLALI